jgi:hypothetical protein
LVFVVCASSSASCHKSLPGIRNYIG